HVQEPAQLCIGVSKLLDRLGTRERAECAERRRHGRERVGLVHHHRDDDLAARAHGRALRAAGASRMCASGTTVKNSPSSTAVPLRRTTTFAQRFCRSARRTLPSASTRSPTPTGPRNFPCAPASTTVGSLTASIAA